MTTYTHTSSTRGWRHLRAHLRAYLAGVGATTALTAGALVAFLSLATFVAFKGLPLGGSSDDAGAAYLGSNAGAAPATAAAALAAARAAVAKDPVPGSRAGGSGSGPGGSGGGHNSVVGRLSHGGGHDRRPGDEHLRRVTHDDGEVGRRRRVPRRAPPTGPSAAAVTGTIERFLGGHVPARDRRARR